MENREVLLKYGKNPVFYSGDREDTGFLLITSGSAAQSSIIDDFATLPLQFIIWCRKYGRLHRPVRGRYKRRH